MANNKKTKPASNLSADTMAQILAVQRGFEMLEAITREEAAAAPAEQRTGQHTPEQLAPLIRQAVERTRVQLNGKEPDSQVSEIIVPHGQAYAYAYLLTPSRLTVSQCSRPGLDDTTKAEIILAECWVAGDDRIRTHDAFFLTAMPRVVRLLDRRIAALSEVFPVAPAPGASQTSNASAPSSASLSTSTPTS